MLNYDNDYKNQKLMAVRKLMFLVEQILFFPSRTNLVREVKNLSPNLKRIARLCFTLQIVIIRIGSSILL